MLGEADHKITSVTSAFIALDFDPVLNALFWSILEIYDIKCTMC